MIAFIVGNGLSRKSIDLNLLKGKGIIYGCNALYRDFTPDVLVATDSPITREIQDSGYALKNTFYAKYLKEGTNTLQIKDIGVDCYQVNTGAAALCIAVTSEKFKTIYLLGFDLGSTNKIVNNCYSSTEFYKEKGDRALSSDKNNLELQLERITKKNTKIDYVRVIDSQSNNSLKISRSSSIRKMLVSEFLKVINSIK
jgi:hypothetical protein